MVLLLETALRVQSVIAVANAANDLGNESEDDDEGDDDVWADADEEEVVEDWEDALDEESVIENADGPNKTWTKNDGSRFPDSPAKFWVETETRPKQLPVSPAKFWVEAETRPKQLPVSPAKFWVEAETRPKQLPVSFHNNCALPCDFGAHYICTFLYDSLWNSALVNHGDNIKIAEYNFVECSKNPSVAKFIKELF